MVGKYPLKIAVQSLEFLCGAESIKPEGKFLDKCTLN